MPNDLNLPIYRCRSANYYLPITINLSYNMASTKAGFDDVTVPVYFETGATNSRQFENNCNLHA